MIARIQPRKLRGEIAAIPSKSEAHRLLICAALSHRDTQIPLPSSSQDIDATIRCLNAMGADICWDGAMLDIQPIAEIPGTCEMDCGESGSTLRFILPILGALGIDARIRMHGRLPQRPIVPLDSELIRGGCRLDRPEEDILHICGKLKCGCYALPGNVSSQYITGMLLALTLLDGESTLEITGKVESASYINITLQAMAAFGAKPKDTGCGYRIPGLGKYISPGRAEIGGDWSNAAFWLCAGALDGCDVRVIGLNPDSAQGDRKIVDAIRGLTEADGIFTLDAADIPDLVPAIAACACAMGKDMQVIHAERLRIKESDRIESVTRALHALGGSIAETADGMVIRGCTALRGGEVDSAGDHRIAMMAAVASIACENEVIIRGAEAVNKSYPGFWKDFAFLGGRAELSEE